GRAAAGWRKIYRRRTRLLLGSVLANKSDSPSVKSSCFVLTPALWWMRPVHRGAPSRGVVKVGRDAAPARAAQRKPPPRAALGKPPRGTKTAGSVRLAVNAKAVMPRGASGRRGRTRHVRQGPGVPGPPGASPGRSGEIQAMRLLGAPLPSLGRRERRRANP